MAAAPTPSTPARPNGRRRAPARPHHVVMLAYPDAQILDITGPLEVFGRAARWMQDTGLTRDLAYRVEIVAPQAGPFVTSSGMRLHAERAYRDVRAADTLLVSGGRGFAAARTDTRMLAWIRTMSGRVQRFGSVCNGALVLAASGLLDGRRATTHWAYLKELQARGRHEICGDAIYVRDGNVYTSAGVTAGMDMALGMVQEDWGRPVALAVARELVLFMQRPGGQSQFSAQLTAQFSEDDRVRKLQLWMLDHLADDLTVPRLAERAAMSERNFVRRFVETVGTTPGRYVRRIRLEAARRKLEEGDLQVARVAAVCGFGTEETLRRTFAASLGVTPGAYRERFRGTPRERSPRRQAASPRR
jgi:transcriptional regulator GlxA family with amidase domain